MPQLVHVLAAYRTPPRPFRVTRLVLGFVLALSLFPAGASAAQDDYADAVRVNNPGTVLEDAFEGGDGATSNQGFTLQDPLFPGGPAEPDSCGSSTFGATAWYELYPDVPGTVIVEAQGDPNPPPNDFDAVLAAVPFTPGGNEVANIAAGTCVDNQPGTGTEFLSFPVARGSAWKVQLAGFGGEEDFFRVDFTFLRDTDGDGIFDSSDACRTTFGTLSNGCPAPRPRPDPDGDGVFNDGPDRCPTQNARARDANSDGCLDALPPGRLDRTVLEDFGGFATAFSYRIVKFSIVGVPVGARISAKCLGPRRRGRRRSCGSQTIRKANASSWPNARSAKTRKLRKFIGKRLRRGSTITIRVTKRNSIGRYIKITIVRKGRFLGKKVFRGCMNQGARTKFKRRGCK